MKDNGEQIGKEKIVDIDIDGALSSEDGLPEDEVVKGERPRGRLMELLTENSELIENALNELLPSGEATHGVIYDVMRYSTLGGGKRVRPFLTLELCRMLGGDVRAAIPYACAVECVHTYSLIHDDLPAMDNDSERRGKPSAHIAFGEANALLAGDALLTYAFALAAENPFADAKRNVRAVSALANSAGFDGMIGGQVCDLLYEGQKIELDRVFDTERKKTGELIAAACTLGIIAADAKGHISEDVFAAARRYAYSMGLAFQIVDDILDAEEAGGDGADETSVVNIVGIDEAERLASMLTGEAVKAAGELPNGGVLSELALYLRNRKS